MGVCCTKRDLNQIDENSKIIINNKLKLNNLNNEKSFYSENSKRIFSSGPILKLLMSQENYLKKRNEDYCNHYTKTENE